MPNTSRPEAPAIARVTAALIAVAFCGAGVAWGSMATMGLWAPSEYRLTPEWRDVIPGAIAACMLLIAFQFVRGAISSDLPWGFGKRGRATSFQRFGVHLLMAALLGFMGFVLWTWSAEYADYARYDIKGRVIGLGNPMWEWVRPVQRYSGLALMFVGCVAVVTRTRQFILGRQP